ncbi:hypothetical protein HMPREF0653_00441 [Prevotella disiens JCM 6334 = ATCC 29426]|uniref:Uncharacterized protein n=1 Tax=Prevotella disiens JCM 6334 = ATCC 29426 TaxID=1235811 RepID=A0ABN0NUR3_9BACT|nr:hypothetical protein HMPREF0653_00441 [Prevotella disiens JCM 6334 = ATCC 29426]
MLAYHFFVILQIGGLCTPVIYGNERVHCCYFCFLISILREINKIKKI